MSEPKGTILDGRWVFVCSLTGLIFLTIWLSMVQTCQINQDNEYARVRIEEAKRQPERK